MINAYLGIDPGKLGGMTLLREDCDSIIYAPMNTGVHTVRDKLHAWSEKYNIRMAALEAVHSMPDQSAQSTFTFGSGYGWWLGALDILFIPYKLIPPKTWMKGLVPPKSTKQDLAAVAIRIFPRVNLYTDRGSLITGKSDSLLLAEYIRRHQQGEPDRKPLKRDEGLSPKIRKRR